MLAGVPWGSILGPLPFLIYINDLPEGLESSVKLLADNTSLFSTVYDPNMSADQLDKYLQKNSEWAYKWRMIFHPDLSKQAQEVIFSRKTNKTNHPTITLTKVKYTLSILQIYWKYTSKVYFKYMSSILKAYFKYTSSILQPVELQKKKYTSSLCYFNKRSTFEAQVF